MKKIIFVFALLVFSIPLTLSAKSSIGVLVGYNASKISTNWDEINSDFNSGFQIGGFFRYGGQFFLEADFLYSNRFGYAEFTKELINSSGLIANSSRLHTGMFQIPILAGYHLYKDEDIAMNVQAGPVLSLIAKKGLTSAEDVFSVNSIEDFTYGVQVGAGIDFLSFVFNIRYEYPLKEFYEGNFGNQDFMAKQKTFLITIGLKIF